jgi:hypothetical protein
MVHKLHRFGLCSQHFRASCMLILILVLAREACGPANCDNNVVNNKDVTAKGCGFGLQPQLHHPTSMHRGTNQSLSACTCHSFILPHVKSTESCKQPA